MGTLVATGGGSFVDGVIVALMSIANKSRSVSSSGVGGVLLGVGAVSGTELLGGVGAGSEAMPPGGVWLAGAEPPGGVLCASGSWGRLHGGGAFLLLLLLLLFLGFVIVLVVVVVFVLVGPQEAQGQMVKAVQV